MENIKEQKNTPVLETQPTLKPKEVLIIGKNTFNDKTLKEYIRRKAQKKRESIKKTLFDSFSYNVKVENADVKVDNKTLNTNGKTTNNIKVVVNSNILNKRILDIYGIDFQKESKDLKEDFESLTLSNLFKKIGKTA